MSASSDGAFPAEMNALDKLKSVDYICRLYSSIEDRAKAHRGDKKIKKIFRLLA